MLTAARLGAVALTAAVLTGTAAPAFAATASPSGSASPYALVTAPATDSVLAAAAAAASASATPSAPASAALPAGLYGQADPTYDGVFRQGLSLLALHTEGITPAASAVDWLTGQQCADGGWPSDNPTPAKACSAATEDTNATSMAVQALVALGGHDSAVAKAVAWYKQVQNNDGGWSYNPGTASDANSTGLVVSALLAAKADPATIVKDGHSAIAGLDSFQLGCSAPKADQGAFAYQPNKNGSLTANNAATVQAALAIGGGFLPVTDPAAASSAQPSATCSDAMRSASQYLSEQLGTDGGHLTAPLAGSSTPAPDYNDTAWAALSLANNGWPAPAKTAVEWLRQNGEAWIQGSTGQASPAALALLILDARATGLDPHSFGTTDLVSQLVATGPTPAAVPAASAATGAPTAAAKKSGSGGPNWLIFGVLFVAAVGGGILISYNRAKGKRS